MADIYTHKMVLYISINSFVMSATVVLLLYDSKYIIIGIPGCLQLQAHKSHRNFLSNFGMHFPTIYCEPKGSIIIPFMGHGDLTVPLPI
jgi:hypothetical protein